MFASPHYSHLPENETFITLLAQEVGLSAVDIRVRKSAKDPVALITRYDRRWSSGEWIRLHQEDFCDLVCTRNYKKIAREMAMNLGGAWDPDLITTKQLENLAHDFAFRPRVVSEQTSSLRDKVTTRLPSVVENYASRFGDSPVLERLPQMIRKQLRRLESQLH